MRLLSVNRELRRWSVQHSKDLWQDVELSLRSVHGGDSAAWAGAHWLLRHIAHVCYLNLMLCEVLTLLEYSDGDCASIQRSLRCLPRSTVTCAGGDLLPESCDEPTNSTACAAGVLRATVLSHHAGMYRRAAASEPTLGQPGHSSKQRRGHTCSGTSAPDSLAAAPLPGSSGLGHLQAMPGQHAVPPDGADEPLPGNLTAHRIGHQRRIRHAVAASACSPDRD